MKSLFSTFLFIVIINPCLAFSKIEKVPVYFIKVDDEKKIIFVHIKDESKENQDLLEILESGMGNDFELKVVPVDEMQISTNFSPFGGPVH